MGHVKLPLSGRGLTFVIILTLPSLRFVNDFRVYDQNKTFNQQGINVFIFQLNFMGYIFDVKTSEF